MKQGYKAHQKMRRKINLSASGRIYCLLDRAEKFAVPDRCGIAHIHRRQDVTLRKKIVSESALRPKEGIDRRNVVSAGQEILVGREGSPSADLCQTLFFLLDTLQLCARSTHLLHHQLQ